jgi:hypothetical protein
MAQTRGDSCQIDDADEGLTGYFGNPALLISVRLFQFGKWLLFQWMARRSDATACFSTWRSLRAVF